MQITFESRTTDGAQLRDVSVERVRFAFRRLRAFVPHAKVQFSDINGPRGGVDKRCQVELRTDKVGTVVITSLARDWRTALDLTLGRATRVLARSLQRAHKPVRGHTARLAFVSESASQTHPMAFTSPTLRHSRHQRRSGRQSPR